MSSTAEQRIPKPARIADEPILARRLRQVIGNGGAHVHGAVFDTSTSTIRDGS
jgi:hypothetical protein